MPLPSIKEMHRLFVYDPQSPSWLRWRVRKGRQAAGTHVGTQKPNGYWVTRPYGYVHVLIWCLHHGRKPKRGHVIDHADRKPPNNNIKNLREITKAKDIWNRGIYKNNKSGAQGVTLCATTGRYRATIYLNRRHVHLGYYDTIDDAASAYKRATITHRL